MHRALPLSVAEARARASRKSWGPSDDVARADAIAAAVIAQRFPACNGACEAGRSHCQCPTQGASACSEFLEDDRRDDPTGLDVALCVVGFITSCAFTAWLYQVFGEQLKPYIAAVMGWVF